MVSIMIVKSSSAKFKRIINTFIGRGWKPVGAIGKMSNTKYQILEKRYGENSSN